MNLRIRLRIETSNSPYLPCHNSESVAAIDDKKLSQDLDAVLVHVVNRKSRGTMRVEKFSLRPIQDLKGILRKDVFSFKFLQQQIGRLMRNWAYKYMDSLQGYLEKSEETPLKKTHSPRKRRRSADAEEETHDDPEEEMPPASPARTEDRVAVGGVQIIGDDDEDDDEDFKGENVVAGNGGRKRKKRQLFTAKEKAAIKKGAFALGIGNWVAIRGKYPDILHGRDSKTIKVSSVISCPFSSQHTVLYPHWIGSNDRIATKQW